MPDHSIYTETQTRILSFIHLGTAPFSVAGSAWIIYKIFFPIDDRQKKLKQVFHRLMIGLSTFDLISSLNMIISQPWLAPKSLTDNGLVFGAIGNSTTCAAAGFFQIFLEGSAWYSAFLSLYFMLRVRFEIREETIARRWEKVFHFLAMLFPLLGGTYGAVNGYLGPAGPLPGVCWVDADSPMPKYWLFSTGMSFIIIVVSMLLILTKVHKTERRTSLYGHGSQASMTRTKQTARQALMYIGAYFVCFISFVGVKIASSVTQDVTSNFVAVLVMRLISPLQGFFNALIFRTKSASGNAVRSSATDASSSWALSALKSSLYGNKKSSEVDSTTIDVSDKTTGKGASDSVDLDILDHLDEKD